MALNISPRIRKNKKEEQKWMEYYNKHKKRLDKMKPTITPASQNETYDYLHLQLRLKKLQMEEDRFAQVDFQNRKLLERVMNVMGSKQIDNKAPLFMNKGPTHAQVKLLEAERIDRENKKLLDRIERARPLSFSAPVMSSLIKETRERERLLLDRHLGQQNKELKERIAEARPRLSLSPPATFRKKPPHESFGDRYKAFSESLERKNKEERDRINAIMSNQKHSFSWADQSPRGRTQPHRSFSVDNAAMYERLKKVNATINFEKWKSEHKSFHRPKDYQKEVEEQKIRGENDNLEMKLMKIKTRHFLQTNGKQHAKGPSYQKEVEKARIENENKEMKKRLEDIQGKIKNQAKEETLKIDRDAARQRKFLAQQKALEKENQLINERLKKIKPVMSTRQKAEHEHVPYEDKNYTENKRLKERLAMIKKGQDPGSLKEDQSVSYRSSSEKETPRAKEDGAETETKYASQDSSKTRSSSKDYVVPDGYRKKFRKTRKVSKVSKEGDAADEASATDTDTDTD